MPPHQTKEQKETVSRVMHEYKHGELKMRGKGAKVKKPKQAIAIALLEAGATNQESPATNKANLRRTKRKERRDETAQAEAEGKTGKSRADLYAEARRRSIPGRSKMSKSDLEQALASSGKGRET